MYGPRTAGMPGQEMMYMLSSRNKERKCQRFECPMPIEFKVDAENNDKVYKGVVVNISLTGIGAYFFQLLEVGQKITFKNTLPIECSTATVIWTKKMDASFYESGLKFLDRAAFPDRTAFFLPQDVEQPNPDNLENLRQGNMIKSDKNILS